MRIRALLCSIALTLGSVLALAAPAAATGTGEIHGRVFRARAGVGFGGVTAFAMSPGSPFPIAATTTSADGRYAVASLPTPTTGYAVCFAVNSTQGTTYGWARQCYADVPGAAALRAPTRHSCRYAPAESRRASPKLSSLSARYTARSCCRLG